MHDVDKYVNSTTKLASDGRASREDEGELYENDELNADTNFNRKSVWNMYIERNIRSGG